MNTLAWHETLELHELVAFQTNALIKLKKMVSEVSDSTLKNLYIECIKFLESNLKELVGFFAKAPTPQYRKEKETKDTETGFYAGTLLGLAKTMVRNYAIAITETATPQLRQMLVNQLNKAIQLHANVFNFMYQRSDYPAYNLEELIKNDLKNAKKALSM